jgi:serine/threonine protein kinase
VFSSAIILFIMVAQHPPFTTAQPTDPFYRCVAAGRFDIFWRTHCKNKPEGLEYFSEEFKDLIQQCLSLEADKRPTVQQIMDHPWIKGPVPSQKQVHDEFT